MVKLVKLIIIGTLVLFMVGCVPVNMNTQRTRYYDNHGKYTGQSIDNGHTIRYYDKKGKYVGRGVR